MGRIAERLPELRVGHVVDLHCMGVMQSVMGVGP